MELFSLQRKPLSFKILGLPIMYTRTVAKKQTQNDIKKQIMRQNVYIKLLGITLLKIQEVIHV